MRKPTEKELDEFLDYRSKHVSLVQKLGKIAFNIDLSNHDEDKINAIGKELDLMAMRNASMPSSWIRWCTICTTRRR